MLSGVYFYDLLMQHSALNNMCISIVGSVCDVIFFCFIDAALLAHSCLCGWFGCGV